MYLTDTTGGREKQLLVPTLFYQLPSTSVEVEDNIEKTLYQGMVRGEDQNYLKNFRLRMWIDEKTNFGNGDYNDKTFQVTVNVYANTSVVSESTT